MSRLTLTEAVAKAKAMIAAEKKIALQNAQDERSASVLKAMFGRLERNAHEYMSLVRVEEGKPQPPIVQRKELDRWIRMLMHPLVELIGLVLLVVFMLAGWMANVGYAAPGFVYNHTWFVFAMIAGLLLLMRFALVRVTAQSTAQTVRIEVHEPYIDAAELEHLVKQQIDAVKADAASVDALFVSEVVSAKQGSETVFASLYTTVYEAQLDSDDPDALAKPLSIIKKSLYDLGYKTVSYSPETALYFDVLPSDVNMMRYPAICDRATGAVLRKGMYIQKQ